MMTETKFDMRIINSNSNDMGNDPSAETAQKNLEEVVGFAYPTEGKAHFGEESQNSLPLGAAEDIPRPLPSMSVGTYRRLGSRPQPSFREWQRTHGKPLRATE